MDAENGDLLLLLAKTITSASTCLIDTAGLWDVMQPREAIIWARKEFKAKSSAKKVAEGLTSLALRRYSTDNVAVVVVDLQGPSYWSEKPKKAAKKPLFGGMFGGK